MAVSATNRSRGRQWRLRQLARTLGHAYRVTDDAARAIQVQWREAERAVQAATSSDEEDQDQLFEVERVLDHDAAAHTYLVRWSGQWSSSEHDMWVPVENFTDGERSDLIVAYHQRLRRRAAAAVAAAADAAADAERLMRNQFERETRRPRCPLTFQQCMQRMLRERHEHHEQMQDQRPAAASDDDAEEEEVAEQEQRPRESWASNVADWLFGPSC